MLQQLEELRSQVAAGMGPKGSSGVHYTEIISCLQSELKSTRSTNKVSPPCSIYRAFVSPNLEQKGTWDSFVYVCM